MNIARIKSLLKSYHFSINISRNGIKITAESSDFARRSQRNTINQIHLIDCKMVSLSNNKKYKVVCVALAFLSACGDSNVKETLGLDRRAPDEFKVIARPPLTVPPQFDLRPPSFEAGSTQPTASKKAEELVLRNSSNSLDSSNSSNEKSAINKPTASPADDRFLHNIGADQADPEVKRKLSEQKINEQIKREDSGWWDKITDFSTTKEPQVKAEDEAARIKKNQQEGKPVTEGKTPETGGGVKSVLENLVGD